MLKDLTSIELRGANFKETQRLYLLSEKNAPVKATLVYGRNGSGKSTIAKAFKVLKGKSEDSILLSRGLNVKDHEVILDQEEKDHIFIFDETFVNENVSLREDGLGSIVMLGEQVELAESIIVATNELHTAETDRDIKKETLNAFNNILSDKSPQYFIEKMKSALKGDDNWAGKDKKIKGNVTNTAVTEDTYKRFIELEPIEPRDKLIIEFNSEFEKLKNAQSGKSKIIEAVPTVPNEYHSFNYDLANTLLKKHIEHPELNKREQYLLSLVQSGKSNELRDTAAEFEDIELDCCPKCYQPLTSQYKSELIASIQRVLSEEVRNHQEQLERFQLLPLELDLSPFNQLEHYEECVEKISDLNKLIQDNNLLFDRKKKDPYTPVADELPDLSKKVKALESKLNLLEKDKNTYNTAVVDTVTIKNNLNQINADIAHYDVIELSHKYEQQRIEKQEAYTDYKKALDVLNEKETQLSKLNAQRESIDIAIDVINEGLQYIFFSNNRMQIQVEDGVYKLLCNGNPVKPKDVSVGERNIIGLCYYFASILQGKNKDAAYNDEYLLIIDDPISSFDMENKIGILSFLKHQLSIILLGNIDTRVLLLTHDLMTAIDSEKMLEEIISECKMAFNGKRDFKYASYELQDCDICRFGNKRNEYTELLKLIYEYANGGANQQGPYIGNIMRQVLEAFGTFEYKQGIEKISTDDTILNTIELEQDRLHYKNLMYRIVLNEGSHKFDQTRNMQIDFFAIISEPEKRRTAKEILCFMYLLNKAHLRAHLGMKCCDEIEIWCEDNRK